MWRKALTLPVLIFLLSGSSFANDDKHYSPHMQRSEVRADLQRARHTCAVSADKVVIFSQARNFLNKKGERDTALVAHDANPKKTKISRPTAHFQAVEPDFAMDSVWPGDMQLSRKKFGLLFAAVNIKGKRNLRIMMSPFDDRGRRAGDQILIHKADPSSRHARIAVAVGPDSIGVVFSYLIGERNGLGKANTYWARAYFVEFDFLGRRLSKPREIPLTSNDGRDYFVRVHRPIWSGDGWLFPFLGRSFKGRGILQDQLRVAYVTHKSIKVRTIASTDFTITSANEDQWPLHYSTYEAQFLDPTTGKSAARPNRHLFVQSKEYSPDVRPEVRHYDAFYSIYTIDAVGKIVGEPKKLKLDQWIPEMELEENDVFNFQNEMVTQALPIGKGRYLFMVDRLIHVSNREHYGTNILERDFVVLTFKPDGNKKITTLWNDIGFENGSSEFGDLVRLAPSGSLLMPLYSFTKGSSVDSNRTTIIDMLRLDLVDAPARPAGRTDHTMAYSRHSKRTLMFGGVGKNGLMNDLWEWDGERWRELRDGRAPAKRFRHAMVYDKARKNIVLFGGRGNSNELSDTWLWDGSKWTRSTADGPKERQGHAMAYSGSRGFAYLFGGLSGETYFNDLWQWDGSRWEQVSTNTPVSPRAESSLTWDSERKRLILVGGFGDNGDIADTWEYDPADGTWLRTDGADGDPRLDPMSGVTAFYMQSLKTTYAFGGSRQTSTGQTQVYDRIYRYQPNRAPIWLNARAFHNYTSVSARTGHAVAYDSAQRQAVFFGGWNNGVLMADTLIWDGTDWFTIVP